MTPSYLLGIDQGTSGSKAVILDREGQVRGFAYRPVPSVYPRPGWVEQDPRVVAQGVAEAISEAVAAAGVRPEEIAACGLTGQRNTAFAWDGRSGRPLANAITWQDMRTLPLLAELSGWPPASEARHRLGYAPGPYMAALHLAWRLRFDAAVAEAARAGRLRLGLSVAWLVQALGRPAGHAMDRSMVQALGLYDFRHDAYWTEWLARLDVPPAPLPVATPTLHEFGHIGVVGPDGRQAEVPVLAMIGDQQAALFGHGGRTPGAAECTHGTASYVKVFLGPEAPEQETVDVLYAWQLDGPQTYCLEAATTVTGAAIRWLRDDARLLDSAADLGVQAARVADADGVLFVPAFTGLNVPYHDSRARATLLGLALGHHRGHIARAFLEAIGYQIRTILDTIGQDAGITVSRLLVGGGVSASDLACQVQADVLGMPVVRPSFADTTAWAAAALAGLGAGFWPLPDGLPPLPGGHAQFEPSWSADRRDAGYTRWRRGVDLVRAWSANA